MTRPVSIAYVDTSVIVAIIMGEPEASRLLRRLKRHDRLFSSNLLEAELRETAHREGIDVAAASAVLDPIAWVFPDRPLSSEMSRVLAKSEVRTADLWHLSTALFLSPDPSRSHFLTLDRRQAKAAKALGFAVVP